MFDGLIFLDKASRDSCLRMYRKAEHSLGPSTGHTIYDELKAVTLSGRDKSKLFHSLNNVHKFAVVMELDHIHSKIFYDKKTKQRYPDYAFRRALKNTLQQPLNSGEIPANCSKTIDVRMDKHTTTTNGRYGLHEFLVQRLKTGTFSWNCASFFPPIFPTLTDVHLEMRNSKLGPLIRAADIMANYVYLKARTNDLSDVR